MEITVKEAQNLLNDFSWGDSWNLSAGDAPNWVCLDDSGRFLTFSVGAGQEETVWQIDLGDGASRHRGTGPADCYSEWEGGQRHDDEDEEDECEKY